MTSIMRMKHDIDEQMERLCKSIMTQLNQISMSKYGFTILDWDDDRGECIGEDGRYLVTKDTISITTQTVKQLVEQFFAILTKYSNVTIGGHTFTAKGIRLSSSPLSGSVFFFVIGKKN